MTGFIFGLAPNIIIVATTVPTLKYLAHARTSARRVRGCVSWKGALTVALTAVIYFISTFPYTIYLIVYGFMKEHEPHWFHFHFFRISYILLAINIVANFYIYTLTIKSFRRYLLLKVLSVVSVFRQNSRILAPTSGKFYQNFHPGSIGTLHKRI